MADFSMSRSTRIEAEPARVHALLDDFREWQKWSPWEGLDDNLHREYSGPDHGVGSTYHWSGNKKAGEGEMAITESTPRSVVVDLAVPQALQGEQRHPLRPDSLRSAAPTSPGR